MRKARGGTLLLTPLRGIDGEVYAIAQGSVVVGGLSAEGKSGSKVEVNTPTAGRVPNGATLEREIKTDFNQRDEITLNLRKPSFTTAKTSHVKSTIRLVRTSLLPSTKHAWICERRKTRNNA